MKKSVSFGDDDFHEPVDGHFPETAQARSEVWYTKQEINWFRQNLIQTVQMEEMLIRMEEQEQALSISALIQGGGNSNNDDKKQQQQQQQQ
eukprot:CAMPEP_0168753236 /NCGR_PEP_ID=MMETSP0724-20121128/18823_1 /TAXON_ID=265536 /ORGANISM="Amphiprora sp., Strain CCMP467" /LENGTH=90 /DNA_ID=CAMNT_0008801561 /DNA_START=12 /DNA_END=281 /DNA_ORIENTATION=+